MTTGRINQVASFQLSLEAIYVRLHAEEHEAQDSGSTTVDGGLP